MIKNVLYFIRWRIFSQWSFFSSGLSSLKFDQLTYGEIKGKIAAIVKEESYVGE